jgi:hypothetical protein
VVTYRGSAEVRRRSGSAGATKRTKSNERGNSMRSKAT